MANKAQPDSWRARRLAFAGSLALASFSAQAGDYRLGVNLGFGGAGITANRDITPDDDVVSLVTVQRAQGPGLLAIYVDQIISQNWAVTLEHFRAFTLAPFSSRVYFTGASLRYYITPTIEPIAPPSDESILRIKRIAFYVGASSGVAIGTIKLEGDLVPSVTSSGIYFGGKLGAEYPLSSSMGFRTEVVYAFTLATAGQYPSAMSQFGAQLGVFLFL